jgi:outer membrane protein TolC
MRFQHPVHLFVALAASIASTASAQTRMAPQVGAPFLGGVPSGTASSETLSLTFVDALGRALQHNLGLLQTNEAVARAQGTQSAVLSNVRPNIDGSVSEARRIVNFAAFGFPLPPGQNPIVGPFNVFDARVFVSQSVFDLSALNSVRAERHRVAAAQYSVRSARDLVVLVTAQLYLQGLATAARADSAKAQMQSAEAFFRQATSMKESGMIAGIDALRAEVQFDTARQRATAADNDVAKAKLQLAREIGLPLSQAFTLVDDLPAVPPPETTIEAALDQALRTRADYQAALELVRAAEADRNAISGELLPSVHVNADFGTVGLTVPDARGTYNVVGTVRVPIFNGGKTHGRLAEADATLRARRAEAEDLRASIDMDVRSAFLDLQSTNEQLQVAVRSRELAGQQLTQARDRFAAGVANSLEVVQAQAAVAESSELHIAALYSFNVAKAMLARGLGIAEAAAGQYLGGSR